MAILASSNTALSQNQCGGQPRGDYVVINVKSDDPIGGLAVRDQPSSSSGRRGIIPSDGIGVEVGQCQANGWCAVKYGCLSGWALAARYLSPQSRRNYRVEGVASSDPDGLNLREGPGPGSPIHGHLRFNDANVVLHACQPSPEDRTDWCLVSSGGISGWAAGRFLAANPVTSSVPAPPPISAPNPPPNAPVPPAPQSPGPNSTPEACRMFPNLC